jgi:glycosyltransferase involved in cell wall biosynthesis
MLAATAIICTHNPRPHYLSRVLDSLRLQTLDTAHWELLLVDNLSEQRLADSWDLSWHAHARHVQEPGLGLAAARRRGMLEAQSDLFLFIDDDNVLAPDYLSTGLALARDWPQLGIWGSAAIVPEYEVQPEERLAPLLYLLAIREVGEARWTNVFQVEACPWGAGMFVRRQVADAYREASRGERIQITGRLGASLMSGEDVELSYMACDLGLGIGIFPELRITHLIPGGRIREEYLLRLYEGIHVSNYLILYKWKNIPPKS